MNEFGFCAISWIESWLSKWESLLSRNGHFISTQNVPQQLQDPIASGDAARNGLSLHSNTPHVIISVLIWSVFQSLSSTLRAFGSFLRPYEVAGVSNFCRYGWQIDFNVVNLGGGNSFEVCTTFFRTDAVILPIRTQCHKSDLDWERVALSTHFTVSIVRWNVIFAAISRSSRKPLASFVLLKLFCKRIFLFKNSSSGIHFESHCLQRKFSPSHWDSSTRRFAPSFLRPFNSSVTANCERWGGVSYHIFVFSHNQHSQLFYTGPLVYVSVVASNMPAYLLQLPINAIV